jgi:Tol biopolymer transport system component
LHEHEDDAPILTIEPRPGERDVWAEVEQELFAEPAVRKPSRPVAPPPPVRFRVPELPWIWIGAGGLALVTCALLVWFLLSRAGGGPPQGVRLTRTSPEQPVRAGALVLDGERVAWVHGGSLHVCSLAGTDERSTPLPQGMLVEDLVWDHDENVVVAARMTAGFDAGLWRLGRQGQPPVKLRARAHSPALSSDGRRLAFVEQDTLHRSIWTMGVDGAEPRPLLDDDAYEHSHPAWSPDGRRLALVRASRESIDVKLLTVSAAGGEAVEVAVDFDPETGAAWLDDHTLVFGRRSGRGATLWKLGLDSAWRVDGDPVELLRVDEVSHLDRIRVGAGGRRLSFIAVRTRVDVYVADVGDQALGSPRRLTSGYADHWPVAWSPDGASLLMNVEADRRSEIVLHPVSGETEPARVTEGRVWAVTAGGDLLYGAADTLATRVLRLASDGEPQLLGELPLPAISSRSLLRCAEREGGGCVLGLRERDVLLLHAFDPRQRSGKGRLLAKVGLGARDYGWNLSPKGDRVAVVNGGRLIKLVDLRDGSVRKLTLGPSVYTQNVAWAPAANALFVSGLIMHSAGGYVLYRVDLRGGTRELWRTEDRWFDEPVPSPDGRRIALASRTTEADLWLWGQLPPSVASP